MPLAKSSFFDLPGELFIGRDPARGPWSPDACHAGPVAGAFARAAEQLIQEKQLVRLTANFLRPIPVAGFSIVSDVTRDGRTIATTTAELRDRDNKLCATAQSLHLVGSDIGDPPTAQIDSPVLEDASPGVFGPARPLHDMSGFASGIEVAYPPGENSEPGPTTMWMKALPLLADEMPSPFQSLCVLADCGNGVGRNAEIGEYSFVNPDLSIVIHRQPESEWLATSAACFWESNGIGMSQATLFDESGPIGMALQTLVIRRV